MEKNRKPRREPHIYGQLIFIKKSRIYNEETVVSSINEDTGRKNNKRMKLDHYPISHIQTPIQNELKT